MMPLSKNYFCFETGAGDVPLFAGFGVTLVTFFVVPGFAVRLTIAFAGTRFFLAMILVMI